MSDYKHVIAPIAEFLKAQAHVPNLEIEGRIGCLSKEDKFDTNISEEYFTAILELLKSCKTWDTNNYSYTVDYFHSDRRYTETSDGKVTCIKKRKIKSFDVLVEDSLFDVRISLAVEEPVEVKDFTKIKEKTKMKREKKRHSFTLRNYRYDLTEVQTDNGGDEIEITYEYEVEYNSKVQKDTDYFVLVNKIFYKLLDAVFICEGSSIDHEHMVKQARLIENDVD